MAAVLAAGLGTRFGGAKQRALLGGRPLMLWSVEAALAAEVERVLVVVAAGAKEATELLPRDRRLEVLANPDPRRGMGTSLALAAARAAELGAGGLVVLLADMPLVEPELVSRVARAAEEAPAGVAAAAAQGRRGHPVAFVGRHLAELATLGGDKGARDILTRLGAGVALVPAPASSQLDVDRPEDLARAQELSEAAKRRD